MPNSETEDKLEGQYHKLIAIIFQKLGIGALVITEEDVLKCKDMLLVVTEGKNGDGNLHIEVLRIN